MAGGSTYSYRYRVIYSGTSRAKLLDLSYTAGVLSTKVYDDYEVPHNILVQSIYYELCPSGVSDGYTMYSPAGENDFWDHQILSPTTDQRDYVLSRINYCYSGMGLWIDNGPGSDMGLASLETMFDYDDSLEER